MSLIKKICAGALAACMALSLASCSDTSWVYKTEKSTLKSGVYIAMLANSYMDALSQLQSASSNASATVWDQKIGDVNAETYMINSAKEGASSYLAVNDKFEELKLSLTDDELNSVKSAASQMWGYFNSMIDFEESGSSSDSFVELYNSNMRQSKIFDYYYGKGGVEEVKDPELKKYYYKNYAAVKMVSVPLVDDEGSAVTNEADIKKLEKEAKGYQTRLKNGENPDKLIKEFNAANASTDQDTASEETDNITILRNDESDLYKKASKSKNGDVFYVKGESYIYVGKVFNIRDYEDKYQQYRSDALQSYKGEDFQKLVEDWTKAAKVTTNSAAVKRYSPKKLVTKEN